MLADFVSQTKHRYLQDVKDGKGGDWIVAMGNEAGDLDSIASAIAYAWFATVVKKLNTVPLIQTPHPDLGLRAENLYAFSVSGFGDDPAKFDVLCLDDLPKSSPFPSHKFSLVDHNRLGSYFTENNPNATVVSVVDHHEDEQLYKDTADPRIITVPTGSCTSLVADLIHSQSPAEVGIIPELATLLMCGIVIDTNNLKPGGKAEDPDRQAMAYLLPRSTFVPAFSPSIADTDPGTDFNDIPALKNLTKDLKTRKEDVSRLGTRDLLRRDYKEDTLTFSAAQVSQVRIGLSSVPVGFKAWIPQDKHFQNAIEDWIKERNIGALAILTSFKDEKETKKKSKKDEKKSKGKHKRQLLVVIADNKDLASKLFSGLEQSSKLQLEECSFEKFGAKKANGGFEGVFQAKVYKQGNVDATRKIVAPVIKEIVEGLPAANP
ncbi:DHH phosphoesterase [Thelephora terrestris]|uniref:DHH phosphoesterase n=1 Tax=Thelephora terrestris TaxID=56493 RepID=A0A9P6HLQ4_9AGAM|nr:DHH phosphoesterase [Thelephora terrestris]